MLLKNKNIIVTGAANGIGKEVCKELYDNGANIIAIDKVLPSFSENYNIAVYCIDITDKQRCVEFVEALKSKNKKIDSLINGAGVLNLDSLLDVDVERLKEIFEVNLFGTFNITQPIINHMINYGEGDIITISSNSSNTPRMNIGGYGSSKSALNALMKSFGLEVAKYGIRCNIISPGSTLTDMQKSMWTDENAEKKVIEGNLENYQIGIPLKKLATAKDIAQGVLFLASNMSNHITMNELRIDGGATLGNL